MVNLIGAIGVLEGIEDAPLGAFVDGCATILCWAGLGWATWPDGILAAEEDKGERPDWLPSCVVLDCPEWIFGVLLGYTGWGEPVWFKCAVGKFANAVVIAGGFGRGSDRLSWRF